MALPRARPACAAAPDDVPDDAAVRGLGDVDTEGRLAHLEVFRDTSLNALEADRGAILDVAGRDSRQHEPAHGHIVGHDPNEGAGGGRLEDRPSFADDRQRPIDDESASRDNGQAGRRFGCRPAPAAPPRQPSAAGRRPTRSACRR